jgi:hypothetical protein
VHSRANFGHLSPVFADLASYLNVFQEICEIGLLYAFLLLVA